ncbi:hypothetical protein TSUD_111810 [Trifolium subterraneum]|uniref:Uncharacterized protein n=1 Tax=Trifolium subterraneum TaxID=3900 RepID=A0A2Z6P9Q9_TRISU|nr:hypothetical protein TSUD_111810 [Trifolium subterraneum]
MEVIPPYNFRQLQVSAKSFWPQEDLRKQQLVCIKQHTKPYMIVIGRALVFSSAVPVMILAK